MKHVSIAVCLCICIGCASARHPREVAECTSHLLQLRDELELFVKANGDLPLAADGSFAPSMLPGKGRKPGQQWTCPISKQPYLWNRKLRVQDWTERKRNVPVVADSGLFHQVDNPSGTKCVVVLYADTTVVRVSLDRTDVSAWFSEMIDESDTRTP